MKKIISMALAAVMVTSLASCKKKNDNQTPTMAPTAAPTIETSPTAAPSLEATAAAAAPTETPYVPLNGGTLNSDNTVGVQENKDSVIVTLPSTFFNENTALELTEEMKAQGYKSIAKNDDGSVTYDITKEGYEKLKADMKNSVISYLNDEVKSGEKFTSIKDVSYDDDFNTVTLKVDKKEFESSKDVMASRAIYMMVAGYKIFSGQSVDEAKVEIVYMDNKTNKEIARTVYPDSLTSKK